MSLLSVVLRPSGCDVCRGDGKRLGWQTDVISLERGISSAFIHSSGGGTESSIEVFVLSIGVAVPSS